MKEKEIISPNHFSALDCDISPLQMSWLLFISISCCTTNVRSVWVPEKSLSVLTYLLHRQCHWILDSISTPERSPCGTPLCRKVSPRSYSWKTHASTHIHNLKPSNNNSCLCTKCGCYNSSACDLGALWRRTREIRRYKWDIVLCFSASCLSYFWRLLFFILHFWFAF